jgi:hypothetical protein
MTEAVRTAVDIPAKRSFDMGFGVTAEKAI